MLLPLLAAGWITSCDNPRKQAVRALEAEQVDINGRSLMEAATRGDTRIVRLLLTAGVHTEHADDSGRTPLRIAVDRGDLTTAATLITARADVHAATRDGVTPLGAAVASGQVPLAGALVKAGARADGGMPGGEPVLPWAIRQGRLEIARAMLQAGADPHLRDQAGNPLLHIAMQAGHRELTEFLLELGADPGALDATGLSPVHLALRSGWTDLIRPLVAAGADPNAPDPAGLTPLFTALRERDTVLGSRLLQCGADPNQPGPAGATPLAFVMARKDTAMLDVLLTHSGPRKSSAAAISAAFPAAARARWTEGLDALARAGANPDTPDASGHSAAMIAYAANDRATLGQVLRLGADPGRRDLAGRLLLERAAAEGRVPLVKLLAGFGAPAGDALYAACARGDGVMARLLIACGVADSRPGPASDSPQAAAVRAGDDELAALLTTAAGGFNHRLPEGQTLLHLAVVKRCHRTVKALLDAGADPDWLVTAPVSDDFIRQVRPGSMRSFLRRDRNLTPLMLAADAGSPETVRHLLAAGAKKTTRSGVNRFWPVNFAAIRGDPPVIRAMLGRDPYREARHFVIQLSTQRLTGYDADRNVIFTSSVSTGRKGKETRTGEFVITDKYRTWTSTIYRVPMPYFQRLNCSDFGLHQGYVPGHPASAGCIRVPAGKALELFKLTETGDRVSIIP